MGARENRGNGETGKGRQGGMGSGEARTSRREPSAQTQGNGERGIRRNGGEIP